MLVRMDQYMAPKWVGTDRCARSPDFSSTKNERPLVPDSSLGRGGHSVASFIFTPGLPTEIEMLEDILSAHGVAHLGMRYAATLVSLEGRMFTDLIAVCQASVQPGVVLDADQVVEVEDEGLLLDFDRDQGLWLRVRQDGNPDYMFAVRDPTAPDAVWFCCTSRDWMSFIVMLHRPRS